jgi:hypothetical protein
MLHFFSFVKSLFQKPTLGLGVTTGVTEDLGVSTTGCGVTTCP